MVHDGRFNDVKSMYNEVLKCIDILNETLTLSRPCKPDGSGI